MFGHANNAHENVKTNILMLDIQTNSELKLFMHEMRIEYTHTHTYIYAIQTKKAHQNHKMNNEIHQISSSSVIPFTVGSKNTPPSVFVTH